MSDTRTSYEIGAEIKREALADPTHPYHRATPEFWAKMTGDNSQVDAARAAEAAATARAQEAHRVASYTLPAELNPNLVEMLASDRADLEADKTARVEAEKRLNSELGTAAYQKLLANAGFYKHLGDAERVHLPTLKAYQIQALYNKKRLGH